MGGLAGSGRAIALLGYALDRVLVANRTKSAEDRSASAAAPRFAHSAATSSRSFSARTCAEPAGRPPRPAWPDKNLPLPCQKANTRRLPNPRTRQKEGKCATFQVLQQTARLAALVIVAASPLIARASMWAELFAFQVVMCGSSCRTTFNNELWTSSLPL
jgi:hypothetical protein